MASRVLGLLLCFVLALLKGTFTLLLAWLVGSCASLVQDSVSSESDHVSHEAEHRSFIHDSENYRSDAATFSAG